MTLRRRCFRCCCRGGDLRFEEPHQSNAILPSDDLPCDETLILEEGEKEVGKEEEKEEQEAVS